MLDARRFGEVVGRAVRQTVEIEVHPENGSERQFLLSDEYEELIKGVQASGFEGLN
jgi:hypothetical protein